MATKKTATATAPAKSSGGNKINRTRRNAARRISLPKSIKVLFAGSDRPMFRSLLSAWKDSRKSVKEA